LLAKAAPMRERAVVILSWWQVSLGGVVNDES